MKATRKTKKNYEAYLNEYYSEMDIADVMEKLDYLTNDKRATSILPSRIRVAYMNNTIGEIIKRLDPIAFEVGFSEWDPNQ